MGSETVVTTLIQCMFVCVVPASVQICLGHNLYICEWISK